MMLEKNDLVCWRTDYLRKIRQFRAEKRHISYTDKTWVNAGISTSKCWMDSSVSSTRNAFVQGLSSGLKSSTDAGE